MHLLFEKAFDKTKQATPFLILNQADKFQSKDVQCMLTHEQSSNSIPSPQAEENTSIIPRIEGHQVLQEDSWINSLLNLLKLEAKQNGTIVNNDILSNLQNYLNGLGFNNANANTQVDENLLEMHMMDNVATILGRTIRIVHTDQNGDILPNRYIDIVPSNNYNASLFPLQLLVRENNNYHGLLVVPTEILDEIISVCRALDEANPLYRDLISFSDAPFIESSAKDNQFAFSDGMMLIGAGVLLASSYYCGAYSSLFSYDFKLENIIDTVGALVNYDILPCN